MKTPRLLRILAASAATLLAAHSAHAALLVYEGFDYSTGTVLGSGVVLNGQGGSELGLTGTWTAQNSGGSNVAQSTTVYPQGSPTLITVNNSNVPGPEIVNQFDGTVANLETSGGFIGATDTTNHDGSWTNGTDHIEIWRPLDASVTATFTTGNTTWFSYVSTYGYSANPRAPSFYIGAGNLIEDRGNSATAAGIGGGGTNNDRAVMPLYWNTGVISNNGTHNPTEGYMTWAGNSLDFGAPNITVGKIEWNADTNGGDIITVVNFYETDTIDEAAFDALVAGTPWLSSANWAALSPDLDETTFNMVSIGGGRFFADEIRIGTTFGDTVPYVPEPSAPALLLVGLGATMMRRRRKSA
jgi:hypothetical protein